MAYKNILWIKLEKRLLNDYRFYTMSEDAQLIYLKLLMLSAETLNKMPKNTQILKSCFRTDLSVERIEECIKEIQEHYKKLKDKRDFYYFKEWDYKHNWIAQQSLSNSQAVSKDGVDKNRIDKIRIDKKRVTSDPSDIKLSQLLYDLIKKNTPNWYHTPKLDDWADEIRKLREINKQTPETIDKVIQWSQDDDFWKQNILSTTKLRKQFPTLLVGMNKKSKKPTWKGCDMRKSYGKWEVLWNGEWMKFDKPEKEIEYK